MTKIKKIKNKDTLLQSFIRFQFHFFMSFFLIISWFFLSQLSFSFLFFFFFTRIFGNCHLFPSAFSLQIFPSAGLHALSSCIGPRYTDTYPIVLKDYKSVCSLLKNIFGIFLNKKRKNVER